MVCAILWRLLLLRLDEEGVEIEEEAGAEASKALCGSHVDEEAGAAAVQKIPSDPVPTQYQVISLHSDAVGSCCISCFALGSWFHSCLVSKGRGMTVVM
jgi:hypothetical protein